MAKNNISNNSKLPKDGVKGLLENYKSESVSGFLVFLIAMPLCLGIAKASGFPPISGVYTAIIGGVIVSFFMGSRVTIKGPAAGLIVIALHAVTELGQGDLLVGYKLTLATIVLSGVIQCIFGMLRAGVLSDFFPHSVVHGMLAAIGIIIFSKQIHIALGVAPLGNEPLELLLEVPRSILHANPKVALIGIISLAILFIKPFLQNPLLKIVPAPLLILVVSIPLGIFFEFTHTHSYQIFGSNYLIDPKQLLVSLPESFLDGITFPDFSKISSWISIKYIIMFALVGSIESLLSAKAIDSMEPFQRKSDMDKELVAIGIGNILSGCAGGLPMISEIVRSSANINYGGKTRWANFFHGFFLLVFVMFASGLIQLIPNAALAALLLHTGYNLAAPKEFAKVYKIGPEQLLYFVVTIVVTLTTDLLLGVACGILIKLFTAVMYGAPVNKIFSSTPVIEPKEDGYLVKINDAGLFTNVIPFNLALKKLPQNKKVVLNFEDSPIVDYTFQENLHHLEENFYKQGGRLEITGFDKHHFFSEHPQAVRIRIRNPNFLVQNTTFNSRQSQLSKFAQENAFEFEPVRAASVIKLYLSSFSFSRNTLFGENLITGTIKDYPFIFADITLRMHTAISADTSKTSVLYLKDAKKYHIPNFQIEKENILAKFKELQGIKKIVFDQHPTFSQKYFLIANDVAVVKAFFTPELVQLFERTDHLYMEALEQNILIHTDLRLMQVHDLKQAIQFLELFFTIIENTH